MLFTDIDECIERAEDCGPTMYCKNTPGSFECLCNTGYHKVDFVCQGMKQTGINGPFFLNLKHLVKDTDGLS